MTSACGQAAPFPAAARSCCSILWRAFLVMLVIVGALGSTAWFARDWLLRSAADWWIVSDPIAQADVVAVLGGGLEDRPFAAAEYYRQGLVQKILISNTGSSPAERLGVLVSHVAANRNVLLKLGVPATAIEVFGENLSNTKEEATALRAWAQDAGVHRIIVPTEIFGTRRVNWMFHRLFADGAEVRVAALEPLDYRRDNWWRHPSGIVAFQNEIIKYIYYRLKY